LGRCLEIGWVERPFWKQVNIKVDTPVKEGASERDVMLLLRLLDLGDFIQLRDATAILTMFQTGLRANTIANLENKHVDLENKLLNIDGSIVKNHDQLYLPIDDRLARLLSAL